MTLEQHLNCVKCNQPPLIACDACGRSTHTHWLPDKLIGPFYAATAHLWPQSVLCYRCFTEWSE